MSLLGAYFLSLTVYESKYYEPILQKLFQFGEYMCCSESKQFLRFKRV